MHITKNPYVNALLASAYIVLGVNIMNFGSSFVKNIEGTLYLPMAMLSLFVFSAGLMGFLFVLEPLTMYLDGKRQEAVVFFLKTLGTFALCTIGLFAIVLGIGM